MNEQENAGDASPPRASRHLDAPVGLHPNDAAILEDYKKFRRVRPVAHIKGSDWARMTKKTKAAVVKMVELAHAQETMLKSGISF